MPEELTQIRMGKIVKEKYPDLEQEDQEGIRQRVIAAMNITQKAKENVNNNFIKDQLGQNPNTGLIDGIRKFIEHNEMYIKNTHHCSCNKLKNPFFI